MQHICPKLRYNTCVATHFPLNRGFRYNVHSAESTGGGIYPTESLAERQGPLFRDWTAIREEDLNGRHIIDYSSASFRIDDRGSTAIQCNVDWPAVYTRITAPMIIMSKLTH